MARNEKCWNCGSIRYVNATHREHCPDCGIECNYHSGVANDAYNQASRSKHASEEREREEENRRYWQENCPDDWWKYT